MSKRKRADDHRYALDGTTMLRTMFELDGQRVGTQALEDAPEKKNKAWQYIASPGTAPAEAAKRLKDNTQSIGNARKKAKKEAATGQPTRRGLHDRAGDLDRGGGSLVGGSYGFDDRDKAQHAFAKKIRRAEQSIDEKDAQNALRRASDQISVRRASAQVLIHYCVSRCTFL
jgi:hypothetical protein